MLRGSALANIGACARVVTFQSVVVPEPGPELNTMVGNGVGVGGGGDGVGDGAGFLPYTLSVVIKFRFGFVLTPPEIPVVGSLLP